MIRKLEEDKKSNWPSHFAKIVHAYNATHSAVTGYSLHYLMFRWRPRLLVNFYFPTIGSTGAPRREVSAKCVDEYVALVQQQLRTTLREALTQSTAKAHWQKWYYDCKIGTVNLKPGDLVLVKADAFKGRKKIQDQWEEDTCEVVCQIATGIPSYEVMDKCGLPHILHQNQLLLIASEVGIPLHIGVCHVRDRYASSTWYKPTSKGSENMMTPHESSGRAVTWCPTSMSSLGWINGKLQLLPWMSARVSTEDGWRSQVTLRGCRHQKEHVCLAERMTSLPVDAIR